MNSIGDLETAQLLSLLDRSQIPQLRMYVLEELIHRRTVIPERFRGAVCAYASSRRAQRARYTADRRRATSIDLEERLVEIHIAQIQAMLDSMGGAIYELGALLPAALGDRG